MYPMKDEEEIKYSGEPFIHHKNSVVADPVGEGYEESQFSGQEMADEGLVCRKKVYRDTGRY